MAPPSSKKSQVWWHFGFYKQRGVDVVRQDKTYCKNCKTLINYYATGNTTNMTAHLSRACSIKIEPAASIKRKAEDTSASAVSQDDVDAQVEKRFASSQNNHQIFGALHICMDFQPISTVESKETVETKELKPNMFQKLKQEKLEVLSRLDKGENLVTLPSSKSHTFILSVVFADI